MANAPFPIPAHQTGRADFRHLAFRRAQRKTHDVRPLLLVSDDDTSARDGLRQAVELSLKVPNLIRRPSEAAETGKVIDGFIKAYQVAEVDDRVARVEQLSDAEMLRIAASPDFSRSLSASGLRISESCFARTTS
jgi:hypothetical protein